ncbi:MAG: GNAT family N-acetyltransferase [Leptolyngbya sp. SIO1D8]|nr:GNAT family N-acetyltransferase [Leptolyngbya sp. SIO1D8]
MYKLQHVDANSAKQLSQLWAESFHQAYSDVHSVDNLAAYCAENYSLEKAQAVLCNALARCCIAYREDKPVGFYVLMNQSSPAEFPAFTCELKQIYILASEYGHGLGSRLYQDAIASATEMGSDTLWLCVSSINYRAQAFYRKLGFIELGEGPVINVGSDRLNSLILSKHL